MHTPRRGPWLRPHNALLTLVLILAACSGNAQPETGQPAPGEDHAAGTTASSAQTVASVGAEAVVPGHFEAPLVRLQRLQGENGHLHVDEIRYRADDKLLFQCSYTFGIVDAENPKQMSYLAQSLRHTIPDDERTPGCMHLAYDGNIVYTTHRGNLRNPTFLSGWDISTTSPDDPEELQPTQIPVVQEPGVSYEGVDVGGDGHVFVAIRSDGLGVYERDAATNQLSRVGALRDLGNTWGVRVQGDTVFVTDIDGHLRVIDVTDPTEPKLVGSVELPGVPKGVAPADGMVYVAAGSEGLVAVDVSDPAAPKVVGQADTPGPALRVAYSEGKVYVAAWTDTRAYDVSNPAAPKLLGAVRLTTDVAFPDDGHPAVTARTKGVAADGDTVFVGNWWVLYSYRLNEDSAAPYVRLPETVNLTDFGPVAAGSERVVKVPVHNEGTAPLAVTNVWSANPNFTVTPSALTVAPGEAGELTLAYRGADEQRATSVVTMWTDDPNQPVRQAFLIANQPDLGVGQKLPETSLALLDGGEWTSSDAAGDVLVMSYFATFCPVCAEHVPELEREVWQKYKDQGGVQVVAVDFHDAELDTNLEGVQDYVRRMGNTHPVGLESKDTPTYTALTTSYKGANPFPVDVVVGPDGTILYVAREYDPEGLMEAVDAAVAGS